MLSFEQAGQLAEQLESRIQRGWELRWGNKWKEVWWRLLLHGVQAGMGGHGRKTEGASVVGTLQWGLVGRSVPTSSEHTCFGDAHVLRRSWVPC